MTSKKKNSENTETRKTPEEKLVMEKRYPDFRNKIIDDKTAITITDPSTLRYIRALSQLMGWSEHTTLYYTLMRQHNNIASEYGYSSLGLGSGKRAKITYTKRRQIDGLKRWNKSDLPDSMTKDPSKSSKKKGSK